jgi:peptidoglycan/xylan/chitin deacetylase (PgdA/CDA1 family)
MGSVSKRELLARISTRVGLVSLLEAMPRQPQLLVINYHRIGNPHATEFDTEVFSACQETLASQIKHLKRHYNLLHPDEALDIIEGKAKPRGVSVLLTFDDGYRDNLSLAVPTLKAYDAAAMFFLVTSYLDEPSHIPWWDRIAWLTRRCAGKTIELSQPAPISIPVPHDGVDAATRKVLRLFRSAGVKEACFLEELRAAAGISDCALAAASPLLMDWADAEALRDAGMTIGVHTHTHAILSRLDPQAQAAELEICQRKLREKLGIKADIVAYPVGTPSAFSSETKRLARQAGYRAGFSFYGGTNKPGRIDPHDVRRVQFEPHASHARTRTALGLMATSTRVWL